MEKSWIAMIVDRKNYEPVSSPFLLLPREKERNGKIAREARQDGGRRTRRNCVAKKFSPVEEVTKEIMNGSDALVSARRKG